MRWVWVSGARQEGVYGATKDSFLLAWVVGWGVGGQGESTYRNPLHRSCW